MHSPLAGPYVGARVRCRQGAPLLLLKPSGFAPLCGHPRQRSELLRHQRWSSLEGRMWLSALPFERTFRVIAYHAYWKWTDFEEGNTWTAMIASLMRLQFHCSIWITKFQSARDSFDTYIHSVHLIIGELCLRYVKLSRQVQVNSCCQDTWNQPSSPQMWSSQKYTREKLVVRGLWYEHPRVLGIECIALSWHVLSRSRGQETIGLIWLGLKSRLSSLLPRAVTTPIAMQTYELASVLVKNCLGNVGGWWYFAVKFVTSEV